MKRLAYLALVLTALLCLSGCDLILRDIKEDAPKPQIEDTSETLDAPRIANPFQFVRVTRIPKSSRVTNSQICLVVLETIYPDVTGKIFKDLKLPVFCDDAIKVGTVLKCEHYFADMPAGHVFMWPDQKHLLSKVDPEELVAASQYICFYFQKQGAIKNSNLKSGAE